MSVLVTQRRAVSLSAIPSDGDAMFDPKWLVLGVLLSAFALLANYDMQLGIAAGTVLGLIALGYAWFRFRLWMADHEPGATRRSAVERFRKLTDNRRRARRKELSGKS